MLTINHIPSVQQGLIAMDRAQRDASVSMERLTTGVRINHASDDPSGLMATEDLTRRQQEIESQITSLGREQVRLSAEDGAHSVLHDLLVDLNGIVVTAANKGGLSEADLDGLQAEADSIVQTINHLAGTTRFNGDLILQGYVGANLGRTGRVVEGSDGSLQQRTYSIQSLVTGGELNLATGDLEAAQQVVESAVEGSASRGAALGARLKGIDGQVSVLQTEFENLASARSLILDTDYAAETSKLVRAQVLQEAAQFSVQMAQKQNSDLILKLLK